MRGSKNKKFYGTVTVSDRGQIVIPASARKDFDIHIGDKMLVVGDLEKGLALAKSDVIMKMMNRAMERLHDFERIIEEESESESSGKS